MHAIVFHQEKFLTEEVAEQAFERMQERDWMYFYDLKLVGNTVVYQTYEPVYPFQLDDMFKQQVNSLDNVMATGSIKRVSNNGYDPSLTDEEDE